MSQEGKYVIHATIRTDGNVRRRKDVVGAIFGQTEGLLGSRYNSGNYREPVE